MSTANSQSGSLCSLLSVAVAAPILRSLIGYKALPNDIVDLLAERLLELGSDSSSPATTLTTSAALLQTLAERHPANVEIARLSRVSAGKPISQEILGQADSAMAFVNAYSADSASRIRSIAPLLSAMGVRSSTANGDDSMQGADHGDLESATEKIELLLADSEAEVIESLYVELKSDVSSFLDVFTSARYLEAVKPTFTGNQSASLARSLHLRFMAEHLPIKSRTTDVAVFDQIILPNLLVTVSKSSFTTQELGILLSEGFFLQHQLLRDNDVARLLKQAESSPPETKENAVSFNQTLMEAVASKCPIFAVLISTHRYSGHRTLIVAKSLSGPLDLSLIRF